MKLENYPKRAKKIERVDTLPNLADSLKCNVKLKRKHWFYEVF